MEASYNKIERIEAYLDGQMEPEEKQAFIEEVKADPALKKELDAAREAIIALQMTDRRDARALFGEMLKNTEKETKIISFQNTRTRFSIAISSAAAILVLLVMISGGDFSFRSRASQSQLLFSENYQPAELSATARSGEVEVLHEGVLAYRQGNYEEALNLFQREEQSNVTHSGQWAFFRAQTLMRMQRWDEVEKPLLEAMDDEQWEEQARWYLALTYLRTGNREDARSTLQTIADADYHYNQVQARDLLKNLPPERKD